MRKITHVSRIFCCKSQESRREYRTPLRQTASGRRKRRSGRPLLRTVDRTLAPGKQNSCSLVSMLSGVVAAGGWCRCVSQQEVAGGCARGRGIARAPLPFSGWLRVSRRCRCTPCQPPRVRLGPGGGSSQRLSGGCK